MTAALADQMRARDLGALREIPLGDLQVAEWNARKTYDPVTAEELKASVREHGIQVPLLVRPLAQTDSQYEIVAGHRRYAAARSLKLAAAPCIVRELDDDEAREVGLVDNLQREDVPALEEAAAYAELKRTLGTPAAIAQRVGKDVGYVTKRLQLTTLGELPRRALAERLITVDHALLLARLGTAEQDENLKWCLSCSAGVKEKLGDIFAARLKDLRETNYVWEPQSPAKLRDHIEEHVGRKLSRAPWDLDATNLSEDGIPCNGCPSNTRDNTALFGDLLIDEATCENGRCFEAKRSTFVHVRLAAASERGVDAYRISWKDSSAKPRFLNGPDASYQRQTFRHGQWVEAKKGSCGFARAGVTVDWSDENHHGFGPAPSKLRKPGEALTVCVAAGCKAHPKAWEKAKPDAPGLQNQNSAEARAAREKQAELNRAENVIRVGLIRKAISGVKKLDGELLRRIVQMAVPGWLDADLEEMFPDLKKGLKTLKPGTAEFARAASCVLFCGEEDVYFADAGGYGDVDNGRKELLELLKVFGVDGSSAWPKAQPAKKQAAKKAAKKGGRK